MRAPRKPNMTGEVDPKDSPNPLIRKNLQLREQIDKLEAQLLSRESSQSKDLAVEKLLVDKDNVISEITNERDSLRGELESLKLEVAKIGEDRDSSKVQMDAQFDDLKRELKERNKLIEKLETKLSESSKIASIGNSGNSYEVFLRNPNLLSETVYRVFRHIKDELEKVDQEQVGIPKLYMQAQTKFHHTKLNAYLGMLEDCGVIKIEKTQYGPYLYSILLEYPAIYGETE